MLRSIRRGTPWPRGSLQSSATCLPPGLPERWRRAGALKGREVLTWIIEEPSGEVVKRTLSEEERRLPIAQIWTHAFLIDRVSQGWRPEMEGGKPEGPVPERDGRPEGAQAETPGQELVEGVVSGDRAALKYLRSVSSPDAVHFVLHYLYSPKKRAAAAAAAELRSLQFETEERIGADDINWLVLACHRIVPTEEAIAAARRTMEAVAERHGGEYDGWEAEVAQP